MKNLGWGDAMIAFGIIGGIVGIAGGLAILANGAGLLALVFGVACLIAGPRLIIKGIHQKAADAQARRSATSQQLP